MQDGQDYPLAAHSTFSAAVLAVRTLWYAEFLISCRAGSMSAFMYLLQHMTDAFYRTPLMISPWIPSYLDHGSHQRGHTRRNGLETSVKARFKHARALLSHITAVIELLWLVFELFKSIENLTWIFQNPYENLQKHRSSNAVRIRA